MMKVLEIYTVSSNGESWNSLDLKKKNAAIWPNNWSRGKEYIHGDAIEWRDSSHFKLVAHLPKSQ